ncbi:hypothetical protein GWI34_05420 [Actinomadura sp. DSM 109109]|nr:hypothetical protein [Actinomadura lepetitiana]
MLKSARTSETVDHLVATRLKRQEILERENPPHVVAIFDEGAVRRPIGAPDVLKGQIQHLIDLSDLHHVTVQIVRTAKGAYAGLPGAFMLLSSRNDRDVVHVEGHIGAQIIDHPDAVRKYGIRFDLIRASAMSAEDSVTLLRTILES